MNDPPRSFTHRPCSDGSQAIETDMLRSFDNPAHLSTPSPFSFTRPSPGHAALDNNMNRPFTSPPQVTPFHPGLMFDGFKFGQSTDNPEPPISLSNDDRARSHSVSRSLNVGRALSSQTRPIRHSSMNETRPLLFGEHSRDQSIQSAQPPSAFRPSRTLSQSDAYGGQVGLGIGLDTHKEGKRTDSISPPEFGLRSYDIPMSMLSSDSTSWSSAPSLIPGSNGSYGGNNDDAIFDRSVNCFFFLTCILTRCSPLTPVHPLSTVPHDETYKRQRRRECHNQVEKRRREHINAKIEELSRLLPAGYSQGDETFGEEDDEEEGLASPIKRKVFLSR